MKPILTGDKLQGQKVGVYCASQIEIVHAHFPLIRETWMPNEYHPRCMGVISYARGGQALYGVRVPIFSLS